MSSIDCNICCSTLTSRNKEVTCAHCQKYTCCVEGIRKFLCDAEYSPDPICPGCKKLWTREFLIAKLGKSWFEGTYKDYRKNILIDRERSMLPTAQIEAEKIKLQERKEKELVSLRTEHTNLYQEIRTLREEKEKFRIQHDDKSKEFKDQLKKLNSNITEKSALRKELKIKINDFSSEIENKEERKTFVQACPNNNCRGFLSSQWRCGLCELWSCAHCGGIKGDSKDSAHICDPKIAESFQLIKKETTNCPGCSAKVFKINGCDQMFCTSCKTPFNYKTGKIIKGRFHNPHFVEWQKEHGEDKRDPLDSPCGGTVGSYEFNKHLEKIYGKKNIPHHYTDMYNTILDTETRLIPIYTVNPGQERNMDLRVKFLLGRITEVQWKSQLIKAEKENEKKEELCLVLQAYRDISNEILRKMLKINKKEELDSLCAEYKQLCVFTTEGLRKVLDLYNSSQRQIEHFIKRINEEYYL